MTKAANCRAELDRLLRESVDCATGLENALAEERTALEQQDSDSLGKAAASKQVLMAELESLEARRSAICKANGYDAAIETMASIVEWCDSESALAARWNQFVELARTCSEMNVRNGTIINLRRQQLGGALAVIRGESADSDTYGLHGRDTGSSAVRVSLEI